MMMRLLLFLLLFFPLCAPAQEGDSVFLFCYFKGRGDGLHYAVSEDGYNWKTLFRDSTVLVPGVGKDRLFRDPCIARGGDGRFHMVWTTGWNDKSIGYASSADLRQWSAQQLLPLMAHEDSARNAWAPEINWDARKKRFLLYWATTISGRFPQRDSAAESGYNHRIYACTTKDFRNFTRSRLFYEPGFSVIDASIVPDGKEYVMFLKNETRAPVEKNIRIAKARTLEGPYTAPGAPITGAYWAEGPTALRTGGRWVLYFDKYRDHRYGAVASADGLKWEDISSQISMPPGIRHGSILRISRGEWTRLQEAQ